MNAGARATTGRDAMDAAGIMSYRFGDNNSSILISVRARLASAPSTPCAECSSATH